MTATLLTPSAYYLVLRSLIALLLVGCASADDRSSGFAGAYETTEARLSSGSCDGAGDVQPVVDTERYFKLADDEIAGTRVVAYYACAAPNRCDDIYDLARTVSAGPDGWALFISVGGGMPCKLSYRRRVLERVDVNTIRYVVSVYSVTDASITVCTSEEAKRRGRSMPCVEKRTTVARRT
jgi:hypothetical protein